MNAFFALWGREMAAYFRTSIAYVDGTFFLAIAGFSLWILATHLAQGAVEVRPMISAEYPLEDAVAALHRAAEHSVLKVLIRM